MYDARQIANWFVRRAQADGRKLSIMQLLKLVYISHGWHLDAFSYPLFHNRIEAWKFGPVIPDVYRSFRAKDDIIASQISGLPEPDLAAETSELLDYVYGAYGSIPAFKLSDMTHEPGTPWHRAYHTFGLFAPIQDDEIKAHYSHLREQSGVEA